MFDGNWAEFGIGKKMEKRKGGESFLWSETQIRLVAMQKISRAVYPARELKTSSWIRENSAVCAG